MGAQLAARDERQTNGGDMAKHESGQAPRRRQAPEGEKRKLTSGKMMRSQMAYLLVNIVLLVVMVIVMLVKGRQSQILPALGLAALLLVFFMAVYVGYTYDRDPSSPNTTEWRDQEFYQYPGKYPEWDEVFKGVNEWQHTRRSAEMGFYTICLAVFVVFQILT